MSGLPFRGAAFAAALLLTAGAAGAQELRLSVTETTIDTGGFRKTALGYDGRSPGPILRFKEGEQAVIHVTNTLDETTSIHWHGFILPYDQDGVPGHGFDGIAPGETFTYRFPVEQAGTYWYHSHSGAQEADGAYGAIIIEPKDPEPFEYDREHVVLLNDAHPHAASRIMRNLKMSPDYYNRQQRTLGDLISDARENGLGAALADRADWGEMRMMPTDIEDVQGYAPLINGMSPAQNWTGLFEPGERVRLRVVNGSAMSFFDVRVPGLTMTVVQADGNDVKPVEVDEFRIGVGETYDVIVTPTEDRVYSVIAESMARTTMARASLAPREGMTPEPLPPLREPPRLTMADMGMAHGDHSGHDSMGGMAASDGPPPPFDPFYAFGSGLTPTAWNGGRFLSYADLEAREPLYDFRAADREIVVRLTGNMERYLWSLDDVKFEDSEPMRLRLGERVRITFVNETMMTHPMHIHGLWSLLDNGSGSGMPAKHVVAVAPGATASIEVEVDEPGMWLLHCHLAYHMKAGMMRRIVVEDGPVDAAEGAATSGMQGGHAGHGGMRHGG
ncbi:MAG: multicopper oxidase domain-containing protein [Paracoccaceae bacterium]